MNFLSAVGVDLDLTFPVVATMLMATRFLVAINLTPYLGVKPVPGNIKVSTAMALTFFSYPLVVPYLDRTQLPTSSLLLMTLFMKEAFFGLLMGLINSMVFFGIQSAGSMVDNQRYVANARIFNPALGAQTSIFGIFYYQLIIAIFISFGGHRFFLSALIDSFRTVPLFSYPSIGPGAITPVMDLMMRLAADTLIICLQLSAPVLIAIFVADLVLGLTNRIAPMINVFELGFNIKGFVGVLLVYVALPVTLYQARYWLKVMIEDFYKIALVFR